MNSIWETDCAPVRFDRLDGNVRTDVLVIGGGLAGLLCTYKLKKAGVDCLLVEADRICGGVTKNTTAKISVAHGLIYDRLAHDRGIEAARLYLKAQTAAAAEYRRLCQRIDCDYETKSSYVYSMRDRARIERELETLCRLGADATFSKAPALPFSVAGAVCFPDEAQFHPLKFAYAIAKELPILEHTKVVELAPHRAITRHGEIKCKKIVVATHFPVLNKHGAYFLKLYQHRSYVLALEGAPRLDGMYVDEAQTGLSFRNFGDRLLLGGGAHRTGKQGGNWRELEKVARTYYPTAEHRERWATQDCMSLDGVPYVGQYAKSTHDLYVVTGFNKWGMTSSMVAAKILCDLVQEKRNRYADLFSPSRSILHPQLAVNAWESVTHLLTPTAPRCPHLGCALKYNPDEHSWDCPCHGSRFSEDGQLINNPATDDHPRIGK